MHKSVNLLKILKIGIIIIPLGRRLYRLVSVLYSAETIAEDFYAAVHRLRHYRGNAEARGINEMRIKNNSIQVRQWELEQIRPSVYCLAGGSVVWNKQVESMVSEVSIGI